MKSLTSLLVLLATVAVCLCALVKAPNNGNFELLILHNNDMHARFEQTSQLSGACTTADREAGKCYGGFPRVAHVVKEARMAAQTGQGPPVLYLNAGDTYTGTAWFTIYKWKIAAEFINALQPDAVCLGNNDIVKGSDELSPFMNNIHTKILASNVILKSTKDNKNVQKSIVIDINGVRVGIVGYLTPDINILDADGDIEYVDEVIAVREEADKLQALNVNIVIALGHSSYDKDLEIARDVESVDFVISGQKNKFFWDGRTVSEASDISPTTVTQRSGKVVPVIPSTSYNKYLGKMLAEFNADGELISWNSDPILLSTVPQDEEALEIVNRHHQEITARNDEALGNTAVVLDGSSCKTEECNFGNLITDAIMYYYAIRFEGERWTDAPVAIIHSGAIAGSIAPTNRPASVTRGDLLSALPLESNLVAVTMLGTVLNEVLEHSVSFYNTLAPSGQLLQFSGIRATYDMSREPGSRLVDAVVRCWSCFVPEYFAIDDWRAYKVIMPVALANGEFGYSMLVGLERENLSYDEVTCTAEYIGLRTPVYPEVAGRVVLNNVEGDDELMTLAPDVVDQETTAEPTTPDQETGAASELTASLLTVAVMPMLLNIRNN